MFEISQLKNIRVKFEKEPKKEKGRRRKKGKPVQLRNNMEMEREKLINEEIEEERKPITNGSPTNQPPETVKTKVPEVEIHLYRQGKGPIAVFKSTLVGWEQDQLDVREILDKYGLKSVYAFSTSAGRGVPIRFDRRNGRSMLGYKDGSVVYMDGEPQVILFKNIFFY